MSARNFHVRSRKRSVDDLWMQERVLHRAWLRNRSVGIIHIEMITRHCESGSKCEDWGADRGPCHDRAAAKDEFHVPSWGAEECPVCEGSIVSCDCENDFAKRNEA